MSKRKIKNGWLEEPPSSLTPARGEARSEPGSPTYQPEQTNGFGEEEPAAPAVSPEPAVVSEPAEHEPKLVSSTAPVTPSAASGVPVAQAMPLAELAPLEQRVRRLEDALAQLQAARSPVPPRERITRQPPSPRPSTPEPVPEAKGLLDRVRQSIAPTDPAAAESAAALVPPGLRRHWLVLDVVAELRAMARMFVDPRYRMSKAGWAASLGLFVAFLFSYWWVPGTSIPLFGTWINKAIDLVLAYALFRVLTREARRYRETAPDLPPSLRL